MSYQVVCDYCSEPLGGGRLSKRNPSSRHNRVPLSATPNGDSIAADLCDRCLNEIAEYAERNQHFGTNRTCGYVWHDEYGKHRCIKAANHWYDQHRDAEEYTTYQDVPQPA